MQFKLGKNKGEFEMWQNWGFPHPVTDPINAKRFQKHVEDEKQT